MKNNKTLNKGIFIVFEGLDGSGKSTQIDLLYKKLRARKRRIIKTAEPTEFTTGGIIRDVLSGNIKKTPSELASLFLADRISHNMDKNKGIKKCLDEGADVISDRYYYSSFAYQGMDSDLFWVMQMNLSCPEIEKPDICIFMDVDPQTCKNRMKSRVSLDIFEKEVETLTLIRNKYMEVFEKLKETENIFIVSSEGKPEEISRKIFDKINEIIKQRREQNEGNKNHKK